MLQAPEGSSELCTIDGVTYVSIPNGALIDQDQPQEVAASLEAVTLDAVTREQVCAASTHVELIRNRVRAMIEDQYSVYDEIKLIRTAPSAEFDAYNEHAELCRQWGREQKAALGL